MGEALWLGGCGASNLPSTSRPPPSNYYSLMASVAVYRNGSFSHFLKFSKALKKAATGGWRFRDHARTELEEVQAESQPHRQIWHDPPASAKFDWRPRPSGSTRIRIWQAKWARQAK